MMRYSYPDILDPIREDPRFGDLIEEVDVAWGLNPDGTVPDTVDVSFARRPMSDPLARFRGKFM